jgi:C1A family cysteine protease
MFEDLDYRNVGIVSKPKDQGQRGSCWAFALAGALEGTYTLETGELVVMSPQHMCAGSHCTAPVRKPQMDKQKTRVSI